GLGYMPQDIGLYFDLTIVEQLTFFGHLSYMSGKNIRERIDFLLNLLDLQHKRNTFIGNLSGGQKRRVSFSSALIHNPPLLILDEPTVGLDPQLRQKIWKYLGQLCLTERTTIILTTHYG